MKILVVDDRINDRKLLSTLLLYNGYEIEQAANGIEALEYLERSKPNMIISDIMMPEMDGFSLLREINKNKDLNDIPFIFYTAHYVSEKDKELATSLGASRFMIKPLEPINLVLEIDTVLKEHETGNISPVGAQSETSEATQ